jgi:SAM-dependent methyltransferase
MEKAEYRKHFELEENFWWFRGRRDILGNILLPRLKQDKKLTLLDAGCGTGFNLKFFEDLGTAFGCDFSEDALDFCRQRGLKKLARADIQKPPFKDRSFDLIALLDVLYHKNIKNDVEVLREINRLLKNDGFLLLSDSAFKILSGRHDLAFHARERYRRKTLKIRLERAGFSLVRGSYFNFFLLPAVLTIRLMENLAPLRNKPIQSDLQAVGPWLNSVLYQILRFEAFLSRHINLPLGSSIVCLARKKSST